MGSAAVETAAILPVFLLILLGTIEFGRTIQAWNEVSHALGKAVRVVNIDSSKTPAEVEALVSDYLAQVNTDTLSVDAVVTAISGTEYMKISVSFPFDVNVPFWDVPTLTLEVDTLAPIMSPLQD